MVSLELWAEEFSNLENRFQRKITKNSETELFVAEDEGFIPFNPENSPFLG